MNYQNLTIYQNSDFSQNITITGSNLTPIDLTNYTLSGVAKYQYSDSGVLFNLNPTKITPSSGIINLAVSYTGNYNTPVSIIPYDIKIISGASLMKVLYGNIYIQPSLV